MSVVEGVHRFGRPEPLLGPQWSYAVLGFAFVLESVSWAIAFSAFRVTTVAQTPRAHAWRRDATRMCANSAAWV